MAKIKCEDFNAHILLTSAFINKIYNFGGRLESLLPLTAQKWTHYIVKRYFNKFVTAWHPPYWIEKPEGSR
jgi:hypothetical protein